MCDAAMAGPFGGVTPLEDFGPEVLWDIETTIGAGRWNRGISERVQHIVLNVELGCGQASCSRKNEVRL